MQRLSKNPCEKVNNICLTQTHLNFSHPPYVFHEAIPYLKIYLKCFSDQIYFNSRKIWEELDMAWGAASLVRVLIAW